MPWGNEELARGCSRRWPSCWYSPARPGSGSAPTTAAPGPLRLRRRPDHPVRARAGRHPRGRQGDRRQGPRVPGHRPGGQAGGAAGRGPARPAGPGGPGALASASAKSSSWSTSGSGCPRPRSWPRRSPPARWPACPGWAPGTEANLRRALERMAQRMDGIPLAMALPLAETLRDRLAGVAGVERVEVAGSLRRMKAAVHDIDLLAAADDPAAVARAFTELPQAAEVVAAGDTKASIRTRDGLQVDLRTVRPEVWGAALQYFTGSAAHNVRIRELAVKAGLKLSEYGLFERGGELVVAEDEAVVCDRLGMACAPPVLREDRARSTPPAAASCWCWSPWRTWATSTATPTCRPTAPPPWRRWWTRPGPAATGSGHHRPRRAAGARRGQPRPAAGPAPAHPRPRGPPGRSAARGRAEHRRRRVARLRRPVPGRLRRARGQRPRPPRPAPRAADGPAGGGLRAPRGQRHRPPHRPAHRQPGRRRRRPGGALPGGRPHRHRLGGQRLRHRLDLGDEQVRLAHRYGVMLAFGADSHGPGHLANMRLPWPPPAAATPPTGSSTPSPWTSCAASCQGPPGPMSREPDPPTPEPHPPGALEPLPAGSYLRPLLEVTADLLAAAGSTGPRTGSAPRWAGRDRGLRRARADPASHAHRGPTPATRSCSAPPATSTLLHLRDALVRQRGLRPRGGRPGGAAPGGRAGLRGRVDGGSAPGQPPLRPGPAARPASARPSAQPAGPMARPWTPGRCSSALAGRSPPTRSADRPGRGHRRRRPALRALHTGSPYVSLAAPVCPVAHPAGDRRHCAGHPHLPYRCHGEEWGGTSTTNTIIPTPPQTPPKQRTTPEFPIGHPVATAWREDVLTRAKELASIRAYLLECTSADAADPRRPSTTTWPRSGRPPRAAEASAAALPASGRGSAARPSAGP